MQQEQRVGASWCLDLSLLQMEFLVQIFGPGLLLSAVMEIQMIPAMC
jgi:hypothetical protein